MRNNGLDKFMQKIKQKYKEAVREMAEEVAFQIEKSYESAISKFYEDYDPRYYERTYSTYLGSNAYNDIFNQGVQQFGNVFLAGINVDSTNIPGNPYRAQNKAWVFDRTFYKGIHGINRFDKTKINKHRGHGYQKEEIKITSIKNMHPAPKVLMDKEFKKITKKANMDKMFNQAMNKVLN